MYRGGFGQLPAELIGNVGKYLSDRDVANFRNLSNVHDSEFAHVQMMRDQDMMPRGPARDVNRDGNGFFQVFIAFESLEDVTTFILDEFPAEYKTNRELYPNDTLVREISRFLIRTLGCTVADWKLRKRVRWTHVTNAPAVVHAFARVIRKPYKWLANAIINVLTSNCERYLGLLASGTQENFKTQIRPYNYLAADLTAGIMTINALHDSIPEDEESWTLANEF